MSQVIPYGIPVNIVYGTGEMILNRAERVSNSVTYRALTSRLRHCATTQKVEGSIPNGANGILH